MKKIYSLFFLAGICLFGKAQSTKNNIPLARQFFHDAINATQKKILLSDGVDDNLFTPTSNESLNIEITQFATIEIENIQDSIEADSTTSDNTKIKMLRGLNETLNAYLKGCKYDSLPFSLLPQIVTAFNSCMYKELHQQSIEMLVADYPYEVGNIIINTIAFADNTGAAACKNIVLLKYCDKYRNKVFTVLSQQPDLPFADSLIAVLARRDPEGLYSYAAATNALGNKIRNHTDTLVHVISQMAQLKSGRQLFPFLDNIYKGKLTVDQINKVLDNDIAYYQLLVKTAIDYADRLRLKDTPMGINSLYAKLQKKAIDPFINTINGLHELPDDMRFKSLQPFGAEDLYYMAITGEEVMYTSSYVRGVYPRVWQRMANPKSDSLLMKVRFDHFRKWIKMAANYNTLDDFLKRMEPANAQLLMKAFVNGLDRSGSLEDAVDVANSYASIEDSLLRKLILNQVQLNLQQAKRTANKKATDIYNILYNLFLSLDAPDKIDIAATLGIPPAYFMPLKNLQDTASGKIVVQQFFYGDKDGQTVFNGFIGSVSNANWKITSNDQWITVSSTKGTPVVIYANKPLDETKNLDAEAQSKLDQYLFDNNINPSIIIHRGHSYWLPSTIDQLVPSAKVVLLGSCGAYQSLDQILKICPTAQIVASKQTGSGLVNHPMIYTILETLRQGKDLNWPQLWAGLSKTLGKNELFDDYVPPHKNLGALFLMAYAKKQETTSAE
ncbi:BACON domain-containing protein [Limnovirga soli]|uniref:Uncharacterized protein n=1 Tax=Limnovirga soli TaxID=2656915 RepID=A0A8J8FDB0_9BACT|nr:BACON domain-containing protein [Limnovirga soli]NNV55946.1 hypothetical protein [Limnovirga soli]